LLVDGPEMSAGGIVLPSAEIKGHEVHRRPNG
jgi:hypothetical protein